MHALAIEGKSNNQLFNVINIQHHEINQSVKVIDHIQRRKETKGRFYSIEISTFGNLLLNFNDFPVQPLFTSVTWFKDNLEVENESVEPAIQLVNGITSTPTLLHLTCYKMSEIKLEKLLNTNSTNILATRGDVVTQDQPLKHAVDLVKLIKYKRPHTSLSVGGHPETHPEALSPQSDITYLKAKVDGGADFIITQICFSSTTILKFILKCREVGITVPIVPGVFIPFSYNTLLSMCRLCKVIVPEDEFKMYKLLKDDTKAFQDFAVQNTINILNDLFNNDIEPILGIHFFTLNKFDLMKRVIKNFDFQ